MHIREATELDIPEIIEVLKASLGETSSQKTESVWRYKHIKNPFGKSLVLLAIIDNQIVGVRAFMRWKWQFGNELYSAFRAVDTATHPAHQGKGIFKKLTLKALEIGEKQGDDFVFNTPNDQSLPGYLKMGWKEVGKLKLSIKPSNLLNFTHKSSPLDYKINKECSAKQLQDLLDAYNVKILSEKQLFTPKDLNFLKWRYEQNVLQDYHIFYSSNLYFAAYIKARGKLRELRISECIFVNDTGRKEAKDFIKSLNKKFKPTFVTYNLTNSNLFRLAINGNYGPKLTLREMQFSNLNGVDLFDLNNWNYSLGDLELF